MSIPKPPRPAKASELGSGTGAIVSLTVKLPKRKPSGRFGVGIDEVAAVVPVNIADEPVKIPLPPGPAKGAYVPEATMAKVYVPPATAVPLMLGTNTAPASNQPAPPPSAPGPLAAPKPAAIIEPGNAVICEIRVSVLKP